MGSYDPIHFSIAWDIIALDILHDDMFTMDLMRGLLFSAAKCKSYRDSSSGELDADPDTSYVRSCLMNYLLKAPLIIPQAYIFPLYVLIREQLEYKFLSMNYNIEEKCADLFPDAKSYVCDICGSDLCNSYLIAKQKLHDTSCNTFCSLCIETAILDKTFVQNNRNILKDIVKWPKHNIHPETSLMLIYRYMDIDNLISACGLKSVGDAKGGSNDYRTLFEDLSDVEKFPVESIAKQFITVSTDNVIHGKGLVAIRDIPANTYITELKGELVDLPDDEVLDPYESNCLSKYVNHSCQPNATLLNTLTHVFIVSQKETIKAGMEITVDYGKNRYDCFEQCLCRLCKNTSETATHPAL